MENKYNRYYYKKIWFLLFAKIIKKIDKYFRLNILVNIILIIIFIFIYDFILFGIAYLSKENIVTIYDFFYKFKHSLVLNISYYCLLRIVLKNVKFKEK